MRNRHVITTASTVLAVAAIGAGLGLTACASAATAPAATTAATAATGTATPVTAAKTAAPASSAPASPAAIAATAAQSTSYVALNCDFKPEARPSIYVWTCADYGSGITGMHWTSWTSELASGYGTYWENDCTPDCAAGKDVYYPVVVTFWGSAAVKGYPGDLRYTGLTLIFPGKRPPYYAGTKDPVTETVSAN